MGDGFLLAAGRGPKVVSVNRKSLVVGVGSSLVLASAALAGTPTMPTVTFPVTPASIATAIAAAGATILLLVFSTGIGFSLVKKLYGWLKRII